MSEQAIDSEPSGKPAPEAAPKRTASPCTAEWWNDDSSRKLFLSEWAKIPGSVLVAYPSYVVSRLFGPTM